MIDPGKPYRELRDRLKLIGMTPCVYADRKGPFQMSVYIAGEMIYIRLGEQAPTKEDHIALSSVRLPQEIKREVWIKTADKRGHFRRFVLLGNRFEEHLQIYLPSIVQKPPDQAMGCVYFMLNKDKNTVKIGSSNNARRRLYEINCYQTEGLVLIGIIHTKTPVVLEKEIQKSFEDEKIRGEWFRYSETIQAFVRDNCQ